LKLFGALKMQMPALPKEFKIAQYFSLLAEFDEVFTQWPVSISDPANSSNNTVTKSMGLGIANRDPTNLKQPNLGLYRRFSTDANILYNSVISADAETQAAIPKLDGFVIGQYVQKEVLDGVLKRVTSWLNEADKSSEDRERRAKQLLRGISYLARYVAPFERDSWWDLVKTVNENSVDPKIRASWRDVRVALGHDTRFEGKYALAKRESDDALQAPAGFVEIPAGKFVMGSKEDSDNPIKTLEHKQSYYIARYPVTVAQYAAFVGSGAYDDENLWETSSKQGWDWRTGVFDSGKVFEGEDQKAFKDSIARRPAELRHQPMDWAKQLANPNRPVIWVTWFEATAYAAWLEEQRKNRQKEEGGEAIWGSLKDPKYRLRLPTEAEWERAARAGGTGKFPWGDDEADIDQRANIDDKIGHSTTVGCYAPNALGLYDMAGNVREWQGNLFTNSYRDILVSKNRELAIGKTWQTSDRPSMRGGSWVSDSDFARCSYRFGFHPDYWNHNIGFRIVLSLADL
jgi:formylglycine-generating enzyme required for sulfatase activity